jgi:triosephosphate isomerase
MRRPLIAGNWKMFTDPLTARKLAAGLKEKFANCTWADFVVCPPFTSIQAVAESLDQTNIEIGGQNLHWETEGAFTGEVSAAMLLSSGCKWVIIGHSERRAYFSETDERVMSKTKAALAAGLRPIVCVGETLDQREAGITEKMVEAQFFGGLGDIDDIGRVTIAYEPVWAIGTGKNATPQQAEEVHCFIRKLIADRWGDKAGESTRILYGGSVKPENAASLWREEDIDGFLVGGASLKADSFLSIAESVK